MIEICDKNKCMGCSLCVDVCPMNAIKLEINNEGFWAPVINNDLCINCNLCQHKCIANINNIENHLNESLHIYKAYSNSVDIRYDSSSGGVFSELANYIIENNGYVVGAYLKDDFRVYHKSIRKLEELSALRKSKYVGSNLSGIYKEIKKLVSKGELVMFTGTPCQNFALHQYIGHNENLILIDFICHGVNSYKIFDSYIKYLNEKFDSNCVDFKFRDKKTSYLGYNYTAVMQNGEKISQMALLTFCGNLFGGRKSTKIICDNCPFANIKRISDITLADYRPIGKEKLKKGDLINGISLVTVNTNKGNAFWSKIEGKLYNLEIYDKSVVSGRVIRNVNYSLDKKSQMLNLMANNTNLFIKNNYKLTMYDKIKIIYGGPFNGSPIQLFMKIIIKVMNLYYKFKNKISKL